MEGGGSLTPSSNERGCLLVEDGGGEVDMVKRSTNSLGGFLGFGGGYSAGKEMVS